MRVTCYIACSENKCISAAWRRENTNSGRQHSDRWRADRWRLETSIEEIEGEVEKGSEEPKDRGVRNERATK